MRRRSFPPTRWTPGTLWLCPLIVASVAPRSGEGQPAFRASADAGAAAVWQRGDSSVIAPTVGGELDLRRGRTAGRMTLASTLAATNRWSAQGDLLLTHFAGTYTSPWEVGATASALRFNGEAATTQVSAFARRHVDQLVWGAWAGVGGGATVREYWHAPLAAVEGGAWTRRGPLQLSVGVLMQRAHLDSSPAYDFGPFIPGGNVATGNSGQFAGGPPSLQPRQGFDIHTLVATDLTGLAAWRSARLELSLSGIVRHAPAQTDGLLGSALASVAWWARSNLALTTSGGTLAADPIRNVPASRFLTFGARWRPTPTSVARMRAPQAGAPDLNVPSTGTARTAADVATRAGERVLRVNAPGAASVEVRGDATEWRPIPLTRHGRYWELTLRPEPGTQRLLVRVDGGPWVAPGNLPTIEDDFGTHVGLLVVP